MLSSRLFFDEDDGRERRMLRMLQRIPGAGYIAGTIIALHLYDYRPSVDC